MTVTGRRPDYAAAFLAHCSRPTVPSAVYRMKTGDGFRDKGAALQGVEAVPVRVARHPNLCVRSR
jgi:hypothetical protein